MLGIWLQLRSSKHSYIKPFYQGVPYVFFVFILLLQLCSLVCLQAWIWVWFISSPCSSLLGLCVCVWVCVRVCVCEREGVRELGWKAKYMCFPVYMHHLVNFIIVNYQPTFFCFIRNTIKFNYVYCMIYNAMLHQPHAFTRQW